MEKKDEIEKKYSELKITMDKLGFVVTGSVIKQYKACGNPNCQCHKDKSRLHGPYNIWTRKVNSKTVTRTLTDEQAELAQKFIDNMRKLEKMVEQMKDLSVQYIEYHGKNFRVDKNSQKL